MRASHFRKVQKAESDHVSRLTQMTKKVPCWVLDGLVSRGLLYYIVGLFDKHGIAKTKESVALFNGVLVGREGEFSPGKSRDQHNQG